VFIQLYLDILFKKEEKLAVEFFEKYKDLALKSFIVENTKQDPTKPSEQSKSAKLAEDAKEKIEQLQMITEKGNLLSKGYKDFLNDKMSIIMSTYSMNLLFSFIKENKMKLLWYILNCHIQIRATLTVAVSNKDIVK